MNFFSESVNIYDSYRQKGGLCRTFVRLIAVWWSGTQSARDNHLLACNFAKYSPILFFSSLTDSTINVFNLVIDNSTTS